MKPCGLQDGYLLGQGEHERCFQIEATVRGPPVDEGRRRHWNEQIRVAIAVDIHEPKLVRGFGGDRQSDVDVLPRVQLEPGHTAFIVDTGYDELYPHVIGSADGCFAAIASRELLREQHELVTPVAVEIP